MRFACAVTRFCSSRLKKKTLEIYDFQSSESYQGDIHSSSFFLFSTLAVPERLWQCRSHSLQQGSVVTPCPAVGPSVPFFVHVLFVVDLGQLEPFVGIIFDTTDSMCNVCIFRNVKEVLVRDVNTPPTPHPP